MFSNCKPIQMGDYSSLFLESPEQCGGERIQKFETQRRIVSFLTSMKEPHFKILPTLDLKEKVILVYSESTKNIVAFKIDSLGRTTIIKPEYLPKQVRNLKTVQLFQNFSKGDIYSRISSLSDGELRLYVENRLRGGVEGSGTSPVSKDVIKEASEDYIKKAIACMNYVKTGCNFIQKNLFKQNVVLLFGRTGSGKSMLCNLLCGFSASGVRVPGQTGLKYESPNGAMKVSHSITQSATKIPGIFSPKDEDYSYVDNPGYGDTRGAYQDIANAFFSGEVTRGEKNIKIVLVLAVEDISSRSRGGLYSTFRDLVQFLSCKGNNPKQLKEIANSISLVVTKVDQPETVENLEKRIATFNKALYEFSGQTGSSEATQVMEALRDELKKQIRRLKKEPSVQDSLKKNLSQFLDKDESDLCEEGKIILGHLIDTSRWTIFSSPSKEDVNPLAKTEREVISKLIHGDTCYIKKKAPDIRIEVSPDHLGLVQNSIFSIIADLKKGYSSQICNDVGAYLIKFFQNHKEESAFKSLQQSLENILSFSEKCTLSEYIHKFDLIKKSLSPKTEKDTQQYDELLKFLFELLPDTSRIDDTISSNRKWLDELSIKTTLTEWNQLLHKMVDDSTPSAVNSAGVVELKGYFLKTSQITRVNSYAGVKEIRIYALYHLTVDEDLTGDKFSGINISIIAPNWTIERSRIIDISGKASTHVFTKSAESGSTWGGEWSTWGSR